MAKLCKPANLAQKQVSFNIIKNTKTLSEMSGIDAGVIIKDFSLVYNKTNDSTRNKMEEVYGFKHVATDGVDGIIKMITGGRVKDMVELSNINEPFIVNRVLSSIRQMTESIVIHSKNVNSLMELDLSNEYRGMIKGAHFAHATGMFQQKFTSGWLFKEMLNQTTEEFDGLMINIDAVVKSNLGVDAARGDYVNAYKKVETTTSVLTRGVNNIVANTKALDGGLTVDAIDVLMKFYDKDKSVDGQNQIKKAINDLIEDKKLKLLQGEDQKTAVDRMARLMDGVYAEWKVFNYGSEDPDFERYYLDWENYRGSYVHHIISGGVDFVKTVYDARKKGTMSKELLGTLSGVERNILSLFAKYAFKSDEASSKEFMELTGINPDEGFFKIRKDYVPYLMESSTKKLFERAKSDGIPFADMLQERRDNASSKEGTNFMKNFITDIESYRSMMTKAHEMLYARRITDMITNDSDYMQWAREHKFEAAVIKKYANTTMKGMTDTGSRKSSKYVELFRQTMIAGLGLENAVTLMMSGPKNLIQGLSTLAMSKNLDDIRSMRYGKLSIDKGKLSMESIGDFKFGDLSARTDVLLHNMISGRRPEVQLYDAMGDNLEGKYADQLQNIFKFVEASNQYGILAPLKAVLPTGKFGWYPDTGVAGFMTNAGSEMTLRNWRKYEAFSIIGFEFHLDKAMYDNPTTDAQTKKQIEKKWNHKSVDDTIRKIVDTHKYELYEKDNRYFGDFGTDTKPFWTHTMLHDGDTIGKVMLGFMAANWYMFRQAGNFGLMTGLQSIARATGEMGGSKSVKTNAPVAIPAAVLGALVLDTYNTFFADEYSMTIPFVSALNQMQDAGTMTKGVVLLTAPMFNMNMSKESHDKCIESLARYGGGMLAGKSLQSIYNDIDQDLIPLTTMFQSDVNYPVHFAKGVYGLFAAKSSEEYKQAGDYINSAYQVTFPGLDNILGGNNDVLRMFVNTASALSSTYKVEQVSEDDKRRMAEIRNRKIMKLMSDITGYNVLQVFSGQKAFNKRVADVEAAVYLKALSVQEERNPGTVDRELLEDEMDNQMAGEQ